MYIHICTYPCLGKWLHAKIDAPIQECAYTSHHTSYQNVGVYVLSYIYIYVNRLIPVPDVLCYCSSEFPTFLFPAFQLGIAEQNAIFSCWLGS